MPLINAKCTNCGGVLQVEQGKDAMVCPFCGSAFIVEKAVQNFNVTNNIRADVVNIYQGQKDFTVKGGILVKYNGESPVVTVPEGVLEIGKNAFKDCKYISSVKLPSSLVSIDQGAFYGCRKLKSIEIPEGTESIGDCAFAKCSELKSVQIPSSVKKLGYCAFYERFAAENRAPRRCGGDPFARILRLFQASGCDRAEQFEHAVEFCFSSVCADGLSVCGHACPADHSLCAQLSFFELQYGRCVRRIDRKGSEKTFPFL